MKGKKCSDRDKKEIRHEKKKRTETGSITGNQKKDIMQVRMIVMVS